MKLQVRIVFATLVGAVAIFVGFHSPSRGPRNPNLHPAQPDSLMPTTATAKATDRAPRHTPPPGTVRPESTEPALLLVPADRLWQQPIPESEFARFRDWTQRYLATPDSERQTLETEGVELAKIRREEFSALIQSNPQRALELAVPVAVRRQLPDSIVDLLEERLDGRGELAVFGALPLPGREGEVAPSWRTATLGERILTAHVFGRRLDEPTRRDIPLHGLALDDHFAIDENPVRILEAAEGEEALDGDPVCGVAGWSAAAFGTPVAVSDGDEQPLVLCSATHAEALNRRWIESESNSGSTSISPDGSVRPASAFTEGNKRLILIRVDFSDKVGAPFDDVRGTNLVKAIGQFYRENSYGRAGFRAVGEGSAITPTLRLSMTTTQYGAVDASRLRDDARAAARAAGYNLNAYDFDVVCFRSVPGYNWAGLGYVGSPGAWVQDAFSENAGVFCHELGHNFGLNHANFWDTAGESVIGNKGDDVEYGDSFDTMGNASGGRRHFNVRNKAYLNWLRGSAEVVSLGSSGTYRLFAHDLTNSAGVRALKVAKDSKTNYWFELRAQFADNRWMSNGIGVRRARSDNSRQSLLLDTSAGSPDGKNDSALVIGRTFSDRVAGLHITPISRQNTDPPSIDVVFQRGKFPDNHAPTVNVTASAVAVGVNAPVTFSASATDSDGDSLAYGWEFGDGTFGANAPTVTNRWTTSGDYVVRCVVSDMRGGTTSDYVLVRVGVPTTVRIAGKVTRDGVPLEGVRVFVSNTRLTYTGYDGTYVLPGLARGSHTVKAQSEGLLFTRDGFSNPLSIANNREGVNFIGALPGDLEFSTLVPAGAQWRYNDEGRDLGVTWRSSTFVDSTWKQGPAQLGYGDDDVVTEIGFGPDANNKYITSYFRHSFVVPEPGRILSATLGLIRDDGAVVYLNGREIFRSNLPSGTINYRTLATAAVGSEDESTYFETELAGSDFLTGRNVIAVEVHQSGGTSSDVSFNLRLDALMAPGVGLGLFPALAFESTESGLRVSWPTAFTGYSLQRRSSLDASDDWGPVDVLPVTSGDDYT
ncbi:MAG TPA: hypothetical protein DCE44_05485, partial [Verrucomicrobiales bacterium]|nr:hypothetical protein [Verrucomicrobiales bacterium]